MNIKYIVNAIDVKIGTEFGVFYVTLCQIQIVVKVYYLVYHLIIHGNAKIVKDLLIIHKLNMFLNRLYQNKSNKKKIKKIKKKNTHTKK